jgi:hypothetical protein
MVMAMRLFKAVCVFIECIAETLLTRNRRRIYGQAASLRCT